jgi:hypothetical protein
MQHRLQKPSRASSAIQRQLAFDGAGQILSPNDVIDSSANAPAAIFWSTRT